MEGGAILIDDSKRNAGGEGRRRRYGEGEAERDIQLATGISWTRPLIMLQNNAYIVTEYMEFPSSKSVSLNMLS